jgi:membrane-bound lytic murein transglycosylase B
MGKKSIVFLLLISIFSVTFANFTVQKVYADFDCLTLTTSSSPTDKAFCQNELTQIEAELKDLLAKQADQQKTTGTLKGDVDYLTTQINALKTKIKARALVIAQLKVNIQDKVNTIVSLSAKIDREHESLAQLLRNTNQFDNESLVNLILSDNNLSDFYSDVESYTSINEAVKTSVDTIRGVQTQTEAVKQSLETQQNAATDAKAELESAQKQVAVSQAQQKQLLAISQNKEAQYATLAAQKKAQADKIRSALFNLAGISSKIDFGTALNYANMAATKTGIDPAFLLAILTQESNLGGNVGQCYMTNTTTGAGVGKNTGTPFANVMNPTRDVPVFLSIAVDLNINAFQTAVSCPIAGAGGYGGAMGPAQFIPSTWKLFASRIQSLLGYEGNPWAPQDAFMASALYLTDLGGIGTSASAQSRAACSYYGTKSSSCSYSRSVQKLRSTIQSNIDLL